MMKKPQFILQSSLLSCLTFMLTSAQTVMSPSIVTYTEVNSSLPISCSLGSSNASIHELHLKKCVPQVGCEQLEPISLNDTTKFYRQNFELVTRSFISYFCVTTSNNLENSSYLEVMVGYKPRLPDKLKCVSINRNDLHCTWKVPENNIDNSVESYWTVTYTDGAFAYRPCPENLSTKYGGHYFLTGCNLPSADDHNVSLYDIFEPSSTYYMNITLKNKIGVASRIYNITTPRIVKLSNPSVKIKPSSNTIELLLYLPEDYLLSRDIDDVVVYNINYRASWDSKPRTVTFTSGKTSVSTTLRDCIPFTMYEIQITARPEGSLYWSDVLTKYIQTSSDVPYWAPDTSAGLYYVHNQTGLIVFHKPLKKIYWNAEDCSVNVVLSDEVSNTIWTGNFSSEEAFLTIPIDISDSNYTATLTYINSAGPSENTSVLLINDKENGLFVMVEEIQTKGYWITWELDDVAPITSVTVMWCTQKTQNPKTCEGDIKWRDFPRPGNGVHLTDIAHNKYLIFGVSVQYANSTPSGLTFATCYYRLPYSQDDFKIAFSTRHSQRNGHQQLLVDLVSSVCQYESRPITYKVFYNKHRNVNISCPNDFSLNRTENVTHDLRDISLTNISPEGQYDICLGVILANNSTVYSEIQTIGFQESDTIADDETITVAILVSILAVFIIIIMAYCIKRKCTFEKPDIKMPDIESYVNPGYNNGLSDEEKDIRDMGDSGTHSSPASVSSEEHGPEVDRDSVSSSGIGSTKCESDVFSAPTTPTDSDKQTLMFKMMLEKPKQTHPELTTCIVSIMPGEEKTKVNHTSELPHISSSCSSPIDSYSRVEQEGSGALYDMIDDDSGDISGGYRHVMCSNYTSTCASDCENLDTCPPTPELERQSSLCDSDAFVDTSRTLSIGSDCSKSTVPYATGFKIDSSGENVMDSCTD